ncbi:hypothetical protein B0H67DRAFT_76887 [Lasiosphaeris hirsuta]|uniref:Uncharacterized protein n=1 Tax=Lasiosphaeris hirsuta TaxID=260670 RepID=A0AA40EBQ7_9PEZI|nr:hypothetical protein B0H67DRAFT_76887 [Lasiosphaeris hirsuta]
MRWWISESDHQVQIVLLAKLDRPGRRVILEKWVETTPPPRPGPITRAARIASIPQPDCVQEITIDWTDGTAAEIPASNIVTRGDLRLEFHLLFLRPPEAPREHDILITIQRLQILYLRRVAFASHLKGERAVISSDKLVAVTSPQRHSEVGAA